MSPGAAPLAGLRVVVTRAAGQAAALAGAFADAGAEVVRLPLLEVTPAPDPQALARTLAGARAGDWLALTSANAVRAIGPWLAESGDRRPRIAAVGPATADALRAAGAEVDLEAGDHTAAGAASLATALAKRVAAGARVLAPLADDARPELVAGLRAAGVAVETVVAYGKRLPAGAAARAHALFAARPLGWVTFTSPRIVAHFRSLLGDHWAERRHQLQAAAIGPTTAAALRAAGCAPAAIAARPSPAALVEAVIDAVAGRGCGTLPPPPDRP